MDKFNFEVLKAIRGTYSPGQLFVFLNSSTYKDKTTELNAKDNIVLFHEKFHHWQSIMTNYGQLKWGAIRTAYTDILNFWIECTARNPNNRCMPINYLLTKGSEFDFRAVTNIYFQMQMLELINLKERKRADVDILKHLGIGEQFLWPIISVNGKEFELNGIDIIESFAKYQEAIFAMMCYDIPFETTMDVNYLKQEYFIAFLYFIEQVGEKRIVEFPLICDLALATRHFGYPENDKIWKDNHPAWRFVKLVNELKNNPSIPYICFGDIKNSITNYETLRWTPMSRQIF